MRGRHRVHCTNHSTLPCHADASPSPCSQPLPNPLPLPALPDIRGTIATQHLRTLSSAHISKPLVSPWTSPFTIHCCKFQQAGSELELVGLGHAGGPCALAAAPYGIAKGDFACWFAGQSLHRATLSCSPCQERGQRPRPRERTRHQASGSTSSFLDRLTKTHAVSSKQCFA